MNLKFKDYLPVGSVIDKCLINVCGVKEFMLVVLKKITLGWH